MEALVAAVPRSPEDALEVILYAVIRIDVPFVLIEAPLVFIQESFGAA